MAHTKQHYLDRLEALDDPVELQEAIEQYPETFIAHLTPEQIKKLNLKRNGNNN
jgi:hypothetical protein